jgi:hypothetical protein
MGSLQEYPHHHEVDSQLQYDDLSRVVRTTGGDPCFVTAMLDLTEPKKEKGYAITWWVTAAIE